MKRRQAPSDAAGIPGDLYYGIPRGAFHFYGDDPRSIEQSGRRHRWADEVRRHGYTVQSLRRAAETDAGYQKWLAWQERKARVLAQGPSA